MDGATKKEKPVLLSSSVVRQRDLFRVQLTIFGSLYLLCITNEILDNKCSAEESKWRPDDSQQRGTTRTRLDVNARFLTDSSNYAAKPIYY